MAETQQTQQPEMSAAETTPEKDESLLLQSLKEYFESKTATIGLIILTLMVVVALMAPYISPQNPYDLMTIDIMDSKLDPGEKSMDESVTYWLGTDSQGRDMLSAILYGLRISLGVGVVSTIIALVIGFRHRSLGIIHRRAHGLVHHASG